MPVLRILPDAQTVDGVQGIPSNLDLSLRKRDHGGDKGGDGNGKRNTGVFNPDQKAKVPKDTPQNTPTVVHQTPAPTPSAQLPPAPGSTTKTTAHPAPPPSTSTSLPPLFQTQSSSPPPPATTNTPDPSSITNPFDNGASTATTTDTSGGDPYTSATTPSSTSLTYPSGTFDSAFLPNTSPYIPSQSFASSTTNDAASSTSTSGPSPAGISSDLHTVHPGTVAGSVIGSLLLLLLIVTAFLLWRKRKHNRKPPSAEFLSVTPQGIMTVRPPPVWSSFAAQRFSRFSYGSHDSGFPAQEKWEAF